MYKFKFTKQSQKDVKFIKNAGLKDKTEKILNEILASPTLPPSKKLSGNLAGKYSRRLNLKHRIIYEVLEDIKIIKILRMWSHYE